MLLLSLIVSLNYAHVGALSPGASFFAQQGAKLDLLANSLPSLDLDAVSSIASAVAHDPLSVGQQIQTIVQDVDVQGLVAGFSSSHLGIGPTLAVTGAALLSSLLTSIDWVAQQQDPKFDAPYPSASNGYNYAKADAFYRRRHMFVLRRLLELAQLTGSFNIKLLIDWRTGKLEENEAERAKEALALSTKLGPTFIKLGQALSIRTDLIPEAYALELRALQDAVPPFDSEEARGIIARELGLSGPEALSEVFETLSPEPLASATTNT